MRTPTIGLGLAVAALATAAPAGAATTRYVAQDGATTGTCTSPSGPCTLFRASQVTGQGDEVVLAAGTYGGPVVFTKGEHVHGEDGPYRPILKGSNAYKLLTVANGGRVEYLRLEQSGSGGALLVKEGRIANVIASSSGSGRTVQLEGVTRARELVASTTGGGTSALAINGVSHLANVTAYSGHTTSYAMFIWPGGGSAPYVGARNVIARAPDPPAIYVDGFSSQQKGNLNIDFSNYNGINAGFADVNATNVQSAAPSFVNAGDGNFHQIAGSITRDAGAPLQDLGPTDFDGDQRSVGQVDIGADEWTPAPQVATGQATLIGGTVATVAGTVNPQGGATTYYFQWGPSASYGNPSGFALLFAQRPVGNGFSGVPVSLKLTGLTPSTTYHYRVRAANAGGTSYGADAAFTTGPPGTPDPGGSGPEPGQPGGAVLTLTQASVKPARFRVARGPTAVSARRRARRPVPRGTTFRYTLSDAATATIAIKRKLTGRRKGGRCVKPTRRLRRARRCTRLVGKGTLTRGSASGVNAVKFSGRVGRRKLAAGRYVAELRARDVAGNVSKTAKLAFTVVAG